jgi:uncharacterized protein DUF3631
MEMVSGRSICTRKVYVMNGISNHTSLDDYEGAAVLDDTAAFISRFVVLSEADQPVAGTLWLAHTHAIEAADTTPRLVISSPEKRSGKSRLFEVFEMLCARPLYTENISTAALFRMIHTSQVTVLIDESDAIFGPHARGNEELRALINTGHRRGGVVYRCSGRDFEVVGFNAFGAVALAGLPGLPDTILDRSIVISMQRRRADERVERLRLRAATPQAHVLHDRLAVWAEANIERLRDASPDIPEGLDDRAADGWEPLLAIADLAGGTWADRARRAAMALNAAQHDEHVSRGARLLADIKQVFDMTTEDRITSEALSRALYERTDGPWDGRTGEPLTRREIATLLRPYGIRPRAMRFGAKILRGYERAQFLDAWARYLEAPDK